LSEEPLLAELDRYLVGPRAGGLALGGRVPLELGEGVRVGGLSGELVLARSQLVGLRGEVREALGAPGEVVRGAAHLGLGVRRCVGPGARLVVVRGARPLLADRVGQRDGGRRRVVGARAEGGVRDRQEVSLGLGEARGWRGALHLGVVRVVGAWTRLLGVAGLKLVGGLDKGKWHFQVC
jgi:hypothetical protein